MNCFAQAVDLARVRSLPSTQKLTAALICCRTMFFGQFTSRLRLGSWAGASWASLGHYWASLGHYWASPGSVLGVSQMHLGFSWLPPGCCLNVSWVSPLLPPRCFPDASRRLQIFPDASQMPLGVPSVYIYIYIFAEQRMLKGSSIILGEPSWRHLLSNNCSIYIYRIIQEHIRKYMIT